MSEDTTTSLIVVLQRANTDVEKDGKIIKFGSGASIDTVRNLAMEKLGVAKNMPLVDVILCDSSGDILGGIDDVRRQQVVYISIRGGIQDTIPGPFKYPFVGSIRELLPNMTEGWMRMFATYGPVVNMNLMGHEVVGTNSPECAELFVKESEYFTKKISFGLKEIKAFGGQGLFTTNSDDEDWKLAHKLLMPAFSPRAIKAYMDEMGIIAMQTIKTLEQYDPTEKVEILDWTTRLTFETIGRCGFGYDFGLLDSKDTAQHPFIDAMGYCLKHAVARTQQMSFIKHLPLEQNRQFDRSIQLMNDTVDEVIKERKSGPEAGDMNKDLLGFMLNARDEHHLGLSDENIRYQVVTFLIAGHDTTANTLAWTLFELARNPEVEAKLLQEIANVGITHDKIPSVEQVSELKYTHQVLKETLRKYPPVRQLGKYCKKDCIIPGGYLVKAGTPVSVNLFAMHRNAEVYPDPLRYDPERFTPEEEQKRNRFAWLPFSTGPRACIGMAFALQEAKVVLAMLLHRFKFCYDGPDIEYDPMMATTKPMDFFVTLQPRTDMPEPSATPLKTANSDDSPAADKPKAAMPHFESIAEQMASRPAAELPPVTFLYGTQTGTAQDYASVLSSQARSFGFKNVTLCTMDKWSVLDAGKYTRRESGPQELVVICTATYNGQPPDSAERFSNFITEKLNEQGHENLLKSLQFAVFGVGNKNWRTYQAFPRKVNESLEMFGAERFFGCGEGNADKDMDADFNEWSAHFWVHTLSSFGLSLPENQSLVPSASMGMEQAHVKVNFVSPADEAKWEAGAANRNGEYNVEILRNAELQQPASDRSTRHIELDISAIKPLCADGQLYLAGDHLEVMPENDPKIVEAIAVNFGWVLDSIFEIDPESLANVSPRSLAASIHGPCSIRNALTYYADLSSPPSRTMLSIFAEQMSSTSAETAEAFRKLIMPDSPEYASFIQKHRTILDLQKHYPQVKRLDLEQFLAAVGVMQPRRYSIASSPLAHPKQAHLTIGVVHDVLKDGREYYGLASSYLDRSSVSSTLRAALKSSKSTFSLPADPATPIIMIAAGTGVSPFRGFLQERAFQHAKGDKVGDCVLFFGCRRQDQDFIYADEMQEHVNTGVLKGLHVAFSRQGQPIKYVQHQLLENAIQVWKLLQANASVYICGAGTMSRDVRQTFCTMARSFGQASSDDEADAFIQDLIDQGRYNEDVWG